LAIAHQQGVEASYAPIVRDAKTVRIQLRMLSGGLGPHNPNTAMAGMFPLLTDQFWVSSF
jgi:hypothetical protein